HSFGGCESGPWPRIVPSERPWHSRPDRLVPCVVLAAAIGARSTADKLFRFGYRPLADEAGLQPRPRPVSIGQARQPRSPGAGGPIAADFPAPGANRLMPRSVADLIEVSVLVGLAL